MTAVCELAVLQSYSRYIVRNFSSTMIRLKLRAIKLNDSSRILISCKYVAMYLRIPKRCVQFFISLKCI